MFAITYRLPLGRCRAMKQVVTSWTLPPRTTREIYVAYMETTEAPTARAPQRSVGKTRGPGRASGHGHGFGIDVALCTPERQILEHRFGTGRLPGESQAGICQRQDGQGHRAVQAHPDRGALLDHEGSRRAASCHAPHDQWR